MNPLLKPGAKGLKTRDGRDVRIYATDGCGVYPIHGAIMESNGWSEHIWCDNGSFLYNTTPHYGDIMLPEPWKPSQKFWDWLPEEYRWLAMDEDGEWWLFGTKPMLDAVWWRSMGICDCNDFALSDIMSEKYFSGFTGNWKDSLFERP